MKKSKYTKALPEVKMSAPLPNQISIFESLSEESADDAFKPAATTSEPVHARIDLIDGFGAEKENQFGRSVLTADDRHVKHSESVTDESEDSASCPAKHDEHQFDVTEAPLLNKESSDNGTVLNVPAICYRFLREHPLKYVGKEIIGSNGVVDEETLRQEITDMIDPITESKDIEDCLCLLRLMTRNEVSCLDDENTHHDLEGLLRWSMGSLSQVAASEGFAQSDCRKAIWEFSQSIGTMSVSTFIESEAVILSPTACVDNNSFYTAYLTWCQQNAYEPVPPKKVSLCLRLWGTKYSISCTNNIYNGDGVRHRGFKGIGLA